MRRLDYLLKPTKKAMLAEYEACNNQPQEAVELKLNKAGGFKFHNISKFDFHELARNANYIGANFLHYLNSYSAGVREIVGLFFKCY